jgi:hypothetical protein
MADPTVVRPQIAGLRRFYCVAMVLVASVGVFSFVLSESTARLFAWPIKPPLTAAFLGANYWAAFFLAFFSARERVWGRARITYAVSIVFTSLTLLATLLHRDKIQFDNANGWLWLVVYLVVPPWLLVLLPLQLREPGHEPARTMPLEWWLFPVMGVQAAVVLVIGAALWVAPSRAGSLWPWPLTPLTARAVGAWLLALAAGLAVSMWERARLRVRVAVVTYAAMPLLQLVALARFSGTPNWDGAGAWLYVVFLLSILFLGAFGIPRTWLTREEPVPVSVLTAPR